MDANFTAINESQWILCLLQITFLMSISWIVGRIALYRLPDISASIGVVALTASAGLIVFTWAGVPRPFELIANDQVALSTDLEPSHSSVELLKSPVNPEHSIPSWLSSLVPQFNWLASTSDNGAAESTWQLVSPARIVHLLLLLTLLGGLVGVFRVVLSSITIHTLARFSSPVEDSRIRAEVMQILARLPIASQRQPILVRQFKGTGSPFVSWLTGNTIFVPESFLTWSDSEQSVSLAHEIGHLQRRDHYCRLITQLTFCLTWLHPLAWLLHRQTLLAQELAADQVAAQATENPSAYCRGLSRLALRFDAECRQPSALGVSVSSSLIRRITMLKGMTFYRLPCSRFVNRCITLSAFIACTWIGCWSVSGQDATHQQPTDPKVVPASHTAPVKMFSAPATAPWEVVGNQPGYVRIQVSRILNHPDFKSYGPMIAAGLDSVLRPEPNATPSIKQFGLALDEITHIQTGVMTSYTYKPSEPAGQRNSLNFGMSKAELTAANPVDWPGLINAIDSEKLHTLLATVSLAESEKIREAWIESAEKSRSHVFDTGLLAKQPSNTKPKEPSATKKAVWATVSGGVATLVCDIDQTRNVEHYKDQGEDQALADALLKMELATETIGWGMDLSQDYKTCQIRFAAVPKARVSADELLKHFEAFRDEVRDLLERNANDDDIPKHLLQQLKQAKVTIVKSKKSNGETTTAYLLVEGECLAELSKLFTSF